MRANQYASNRVYPHHTMCIQLSLNSFHFILSTSHYIQLSLNSFQFMLSISHHVCILNCYWNHCYQYHTMCIQLSLNTFHFILSTSHHVYSIIIEFHFFLSTSHHVYSSSLNTFHIILSTSHHVYSIFIEHLSLLPINITPCLFNYQWTPFTSSYQHHNMCIQLSLNSVYFFLSTSHHVNSVFTELLSLYPINITPCVFNHWTPFTSSFQHHTMCIQSSLNSFHFILSTSHHTIVSLYSPCVFNHHWTPFTSSFQYHTLCIQIIELLSLHPFNITPCVFNHHWTPHFTSSFQHHTPVYCELLSLHPIHPVYSIIIELLSLHPFNITPCVFNHHWTPFTSSFQYHTLCIQSSLNSFHCVFNYNWTPFLLQIWSTGSISVGRSWWLERHGRTWRSRSLAASSWPRRPLVSMATSARPTTVQVEF